MDGKYMDGYLSDVSRYMDGLWMIYLLNKPYPYTIHILPRHSNLDFAPIKGVFDFYPNIFVLEVFFVGLGI